MESQSIVRIATGSYARPPVLPSMSHRHFNLKHALLHYLYRLRRRRLKNLLNDVCLRFTCGRFLRLLAIFLTRAHYLRVVVSGRG